MLDIFDFIVVNHIMLYENCLDNMMTLKNFSEMLYDGLTGGDHSKNIIIESGSTGGESCTFFTCSNSRTSVSDCACSSCFPYLKVDCSIGFLFSWKVVFGSLASTSWFIVTINVLNLIVIFLGRFSVHLVLNINWINSSLLDLLVYSIR